MFRSVLLSAAALCLANVALAQGTSHPNLLLIVPDDLGIDSVGCYGMPNPAPTPVLNAIAQHGMRFTRMFANPACSPSRATMFTGRYAFRSSCTMALPWGAVGIAGTEVMLPLPLMAAGYHTAMIGKWHLGNRFGPSTPNAFGWSHFEGVLESGVADPYHWPKVTNGVASTCNTYVMTDEVDSALQWIQAQTGPWALALTMTLPHQPYHSPPAALHTQNLAGLNPATTPRPFFLAMVQAMDAEIGRLLQTLGPSVLANTNVIVMPDNGTDAAVALAPVPPNHSKGSLYEFGSHVPLIVSGPAVSQPGTTCPALLSGVDLFPTMLQMCGVSYPTPAWGSVALPLDGVSFAAALTNPTLPGRSFLYSEIEGTPLGQGYTVRTGTHRLIRYMRTLPQHQELYNLAADAFELNDLLTAPLTPAAATAFDNLMTKMETIRDDGWAELFGSGCAGSAGVPLLSSQNQPRLGTTFYARVTGLAPNAIGLLGLIGFSRDSSGTVPLPLDLTALGMPGCKFAVRPDITLQFVPTTYSTGVMIPPTPSLYKTEFYVQALVGEPGVNSANLIWSRGLRCVIGH